MSAASSGAYGKIVMRFYLGWAVLWLSNAFFSHRMPSVRTLTLQGHIFPGSGLTMNGGHGHANVQDTIRPSTAP